MDDKHRIIETKWNDIKITSNKKPLLSKNAKLVLEKRYLARDKNGKMLESPEDMFKRISKYIASADFLFKKTNSEVSETATFFYEMMTELEFIPNSPTLMNAGKPLGQQRALELLAGH